MSVNVTVGSDTFKIPVQGEGAGWGEDTTAWIQAVSESLSSVFNSQDLRATAASLANNQSSAANIVGLKFDTSEVISVEVKFFIKRIYDSGSSVLVETGSILGYYSGSTFVISVESVGNAGVTIDVTNTGQFQYTSTNLANSVSNIIVFTAKTMLNP